MFTISVIMPTYNYAQYLSRAIDSVLAQTYKDFEIIVIDDGSTDHTKEVLRPYMDKIRYVYQQNQGIAAARNRGIKEAQGKWIAFLDSDDSWVPEKLAIQADIMVKDPSVGLIYGKVTLFREDGTRVEVYPTREPGRNAQELAERLGYLPTSTIMASKDLVLQVGLFDEDLPTSEDLDLWVRIARVAKIHEVDSPILARHYIHGSNITSNEMKMYEGWVKFHYKVLREYKDISPAKIFRVLTKNEYALARVYCGQKKFKQALCLARRAILRHPHVGTFFYSPGDSIVMKIKKFLNPYFLCFSIGKYKNADAARKLFSYAAKKIRRTK
ncbi:MAG: glycosyltransferase [Candidatus Omnitrophica bacterium]|nr:glycosyltransferase [Candidatus Omnitrophota bacterium]